jgi:hypothetical protein
MEAHITISSFKSTTSMTRSQIEKRSDLRRKVKEARPQLGRRVVKSQPGRLDHGQDAKWRNGIYGELGVGHSAYLVVGT